MQRPFFSLVRSGLWGTAADTSLFQSLTPGDWQELYRMAQSQALLALTFDGISTLPAELRPPRTLYLQWAANTARIEQANERLNRMVTELQSLYTGAGLHPVLLKGQGIATNYRNPLHRQCGDIDIYLGKKGQPVANCLLLQQGARVEGEASDKHASYDLRGVHIENHRIILRLNNPLANRRFRKLVEEWYPQGAEIITQGDEIIPTEAGDKQPPHSLPMPVPPPTFNALYIFLHAFVHFLNSGIGLRQLCDWTCLLARRHRDIDGQALLNQLQDLGLLRAAQAFGYIAVTRLGLPANYLPIPLEDAKERGEKLLEDIFATGNFGQHDVRIKPRPKGYWAGKWHTFCRATRRCNELRQFAPGEALWYPVTLIKGTVVIQINRIKDRPHLCKPRN